MSATTTSSIEVVEHFTSEGQIAQKQLDWWMHREGCEDVAEKVLSHVTETPYSIASGEIPNLRTQHALGNVRKEEAEKIELIRDWFPDFAFTHVFHLMLEEEKRLYKWEEFYDWCQGENVRRWLWEPAQEMVRQAQVQGFTYRHASDAMRWRVGNFYYSFLRELYVLAMLREHGLPMKFHPLADALFRADAWCENVLLELFIGNRTFKSGNDGRKRKTEDYFADQPKFEVVRFEMRLQRKFGTVHVPSSEQIDRCAKLIECAVGR
ncbi:hypothetical protein IU500_31165 [Nocardia terpenica]|uniref:hypothetical protein n=1 Tax=Nocardia terpenica TaxID=455432 RepID=UPI0018943AA8|nr:hypothetical protein [Nocardia terpenica]MBF6063869.1 hypothetical protein [Nocardia terpenica]MBF6108479.1 hypothetical protein [Nocardia terpenica]MBF6116025.1 hypothetical protein [Nocardia terpenica]MBF6121050.1 hypothetical protein [Nocardia terpenica]MBF6156678.1 hypothetical protein [Nocardia terpenica]